MKKMRMLDRVVINTDYFNSPSNQQGYQIWTIPETELIYKRYEVAGGKNNLTQYKKWKSVLWTQGFST